jgi:tripartite-type tricarboxylate transporter receptor subunit TctC
MTFVRSTGWAAAIFATSAAWCGLSLQASAQTPEQFYKGRQIELAIGYPPAGSNDVYARLLARHLGRHIPGNPTIVPQNRPGAGSFLALAYMANVAPKDGSVIAIGAPTAPLDEKLGTQGVRFKTAEFNWIGRIDSLINIVFTWHTSPVKTAADAFKTEAKLSGTGVGSTVSIYPTVMNHVLGSKFKLIMGYKGSNDAQLAVERGEVEGHSTSWTAVKVAHPTWRSEKKINILVQFSVRKHPELQDVPTVVELARTDEQRQVLSAVVNAAEIGTAFFTTPGAPQDRVQTLRRAFDATMKDPQFLDEAGKLQLSVGPLTGEELQKVVAGVAAIKPDILEKVREAYTAVR